jgi:hypothetical protein
MFPGHPVAETFACSETKCRYLCHFGLGPYFLNLLKSRVREESDYVILFDESLNKKTKNKQLDLHIRMWHHDKVHTRYLNSEFVGHGAAVDLLEHFKASTSDLNRTGLLQVSMDGPSVNWSFYDKLEKSHMHEYDLGLLNIGSCGMHVVHGGFQTGAKQTGWKVDDILSSAYHLFHECPARREDFVTVTGCSDFPLKLCRHRWLENGPVCSRVPLLWPQLKLYVEACKKKKVSVPTCNSYKVICDALDIPLSIARLSFFMFLTKEVEPFLFLYQTDRPMGPFLVGDIEKMVRNLLDKCIKTAALTNASSVYNLLKLDLEKEKVENKKVEVGFKAESELRALKSDKKISERQVFEFREECRSFLTKFVGKIFERSPLKYSLARNLACLWLA